MLPPGSGRMGKRRRAMCKSWSQGDLERDLELSYHLSRRMEQTRLGRYICKICCILASLLCASILCGYVADNQPLNQTRLVFGRLMWGCDELYCVIT